MKKLIFSCISGNDCTKTQQSFYHIHNLLWFTLHMKRKRELLIAGTLNHPTTGVYHLKRNMLNEKC